MAYHDSSLSYTHEWPWTTMMVHGPTAMGDNVLLNGTTVFNGHQTVPDHSKPLSLAMVNRG